MLTRGNEIRLLFAAATEISLELLVLEAPAVAGRPPENIYYFFAALDCRKQVPVNCLSP
jgi:hypothetical protein